MSITGVPTISRLSIAFAVIVRDELRDRASEMTFADRNDSIETFFFNRSHEALRVRIRIRRAFGHQHDGMPTSPNRRRTSRLHFRSRSQINTCGMRAAASSAIVSVRTICCMNIAPGCGVEPRIFTRRETRSITNAV
jgi:hypothetical protein